MSAIKLREMDVNSMSTLNMAMPPGVDVTDAFNRKQVHHQSGKPDKTSKHGRSKNGRHIENLKSQEGMVVWYAAERGRTCALIKTAAIISDVKKWKELKNVHELFIDDEEGALRTLPSDFGSVKHLKVLSIRFTKIKTLVSNLNGLPTTHVCLTHNRLTTVAGIETMAKITVLDLSFNSIQSLPESLDNLRSLKHLALNGNKLKSLPYQLGNLKNLRELHASSNKLTALPESACNLHKLQTLDVSMNCLTELPAKIGSLMELIQLFLSCNKLKALPSSLQHASALKYLFIRYNCLTEVPNFLSYLPSLEFLNVQNNKIVDVKTSIGCLRTLLLDHNNLQEIPSAVFGCRNLETLTLQGNCIEDVSVKIGELKKLRLLYLGDNNLQDIPREVCELPDLKHLMLQGNKVKVLPREFHAMANLTQFEINEEELEPNMAAAYQRGILALKEFVRTVPVYQNCAGEGPHRSVVSTLKRQSSNLDREDTQRQNERNSTQAMQERKNRHQSGSKQVEKKPSDRRVERPSRGKKSVKYDKTGPTLVKIK